MILWIGNQNTEAKPVELAKTFLCNFSQILRFTKLITKLMLTGFDKYAIILYSVICYFIVKPLNKAEIVNQKTERN